MSELWNLIKASCEAEVNSDPRFSEPESAKTSMDLFNHFVEHYGEFVNRATDLTDGHLVLAVLAKDPEAAIYVSANAALNVGLRIYAMVKALSPETIELLDQKDPLKFDTLSMSWEEEDESPE